MQARSNTECYDAIAKDPYQGILMSVPKLSFHHGIIDPQCNNIELNVLANATFNC
jgi:hypothetical protein